MAREVPVRPRKEPRHERARATVDAILMAAAHILRTEGSEAATTNRIAELAGVSIGSLYQYFPNKQAVVGALRERHAEWFGGRLRAEIDGDGVSILRYQGPIPPRAVATDYGAPPVVADADLMAAEAEARAAAAERAADRAEEIARQMDRQFKRSLGKR